MPTVEQRWLTSAQAAAYLGLTPRALEKRVHRRQIPFTRLTDSARGPLRFDRKKLDTWMESRAVPEGGAR